MNVLIAFLCGIFCFALGFFSGSSTRRSDLYCLLIHLKSLLDRRKDELEQFKNDHPDFYKELKEIVDEAKNNSHWDKRQSKRQKHKELVP